MPETNGNAAMHGLHKELIAWQAGLLARQLKGADINDVLELMGFMIRAIESSMLIIAEDLRTLETRIKALEAQNRGNA